MSNKKYSLESGTPLLDVVPAGAENMKAMGEVSKGAGEGTKGSRASSSISKILEDFAEAYAHYHIPDATKKDIQTAQQEIEAYVLDIIGEDDKPTGEMELTLAFAMRNELRAEQRNKLKGKK